MFEFVTLLFAIGVLLMAFGHTKLKWPLFHVALLMMIISTQAETTEGKLYGLMFLISIFYIIGVKDDVL